MFHTKQNQRAMTAWMTYATALGRMQMAAAEVILRRTHQMATGTMTHPEAIGMVLEKGTAMAVSAEKAMVAAARGGDALRVASAALRPFGSKTRSNVRKLRR